MAATSAPMSAAFRGALMGGRSVRAEGSTLAMASQSLPSARVMAALDAGLSLSARRPWMRVYSATRTGMRASTLAVLAVLTGLDIGDSCVWIVGGRGDCLARVILP